MQYAISYSRFSTGIQQKGSSLSRQQQQVAEYCRKHNLHLLDSFHDAGKSGFHAKHLQEGGQLRLLLDQVTDGTIPKGTHLLVEQTDRLTRQAVLSGLTIIQQLVSAGLVIVTLDDGQSYDDKTDFGKLVLLMARLQRGHDESKAKSDRLSYVWNEKAEKMQEGSLPKMRMPFWLERKGQEVHIVEDWVKVIEEVFQDCIDGYGCAAIATKLNDRGLKTKMGAKWTSSSITQLIRNERIIGWHRRRETNDRYKIYPPIMTIERFNEAQSALDTRVRSKGNTQKWSSALTGGLTQCGSCGSVLKFSGKSKYRTGVCRAAVDGGNVCCNKQSLRYKALILGTVLALHWDLADKITQKAQPKPRDNKRDELEHELDSLNGKIKQLTEAIAITDDIPELASSIQNLNKRREEIKLELTTLQDPVDHDTLISQRHEIVTKQIPNLTESVLAGEKEASSKLNILLHTLGDLKIVLQDGVANINGTKVWFDKKTMKVDGGYHGSGQIVHKPEGNKREVNIGTEDNPRFMMVEENWHPLGGGYYFEPDYEEVLENT